MKLIPKLMQALLMALLLCVLPKTVIAERNWYCSQSYAGGTECDAEYADTLAYCSTFTSCSNFCSCFYGHMDNCQPTSMSCSSGGVGFCSYTDCEYPEDCCGAMGCVSGGCEQEY